MLQLHAPGQELTRLIPLLYDSDPQDLAAHRLMHRGLRDINDPGGEDFATNIMTKMGFAHVYDDHDVSTVWCCILFVVSVYLLMSCDPSCVLATRLMLTTCFSLYFYLLVLILSLFSTVLWKRLRWYLFLQNRRSQGLRRVLSRISSSQPLGWHLSQVYNR